MFPKTDKIAVQTGTPAYLFPTLSAQAHLTAAGSLSLTHLRNMDEWQELH